MTQNKKPNKKLLINLFLVFAAGFAFLFMCYVGLPYDFNADHPMIIRSTASANYSELANLVMDPRTPVWFYPPSSRTDLMVYVRPLQLLLLKLSYDLFGYSLPHIHMIAATGCGILMVLFFSLIVFWTGNMLWGWLAVVLYLTFPSHVFMLLSDYAGDFQFFLSVISVSALLLFGRLTSRQLRPNVFFANQALWVILIWIAIKLKSSEKILPVVCLTFLIWQFRSIRAQIGSWRTAMLVLAIAGTFILVVPSTANFHQFLQKVQRTDRVLPTADTSADTLKDKQALSFKWQNALKRTFYASNVKFALRSIYHRDRNPLSFTENYGFLLGSFFWLGLLSSVFLWTVFKQRITFPDMPPHQEFLPHYFKLFLVWFAAIIAGFSTGMNLAENRFLNFAYVPSILLLFMMIGTISRYLAKSMLGSRVFRILVVLSIAVTTLFNFVTLAKLVGYYGGMQAVLVRAEKDIFPIVYGYDPDQRSLYEKHQDLERRAVTVGWYDYSKDWTEVTRDKLKTEKTVFLYLRKSDPERLKSLKKSGFEVILWKQYSLLDAKPLLFRFLRELYRFKKSGTDIPSTDIFVYRIQRSPAGTI